MKHLHLIFGMALPFFSCAQKLAMFQSVLYFNDLKGNVDSLWIGYDTAANGQFNPEYGELDLEHSFDSVFEVRASHRNKAPIAEAGAILSKKVIGHAELELVEPPSRSCYSGQTIVIYIKAKYPPVRISWDRFQFIDSLGCNPGCFVTPDYLYDISDPVSLWLHFENKRFACLPKEEYFEINLDPQFTKANFPKEITHRLVRTFNDGLTDTLFGVALHFIPHVSESPCVLNVGAQVAKTLSERIQFYPNPALHTVMLRVRDLESVASIDCVSLDGSCHTLQYNLCKQSGSILLSVDGLPPGMQFLIVRYHDGNLEEVPFIKL